MLDKIIEILKDSGVHAWEINDVTTKGWEFYFIRHALDQHRAKNVEHIYVTVYQLIEDGQFMGNASAELPLTASYDEAKKLIGDLAYRATLVKNRPYTLNPPRPGKPISTPVDPAAISEEFICSMQELPETEGEDVNSYEIFVSDKTVRFLNSEGVDVTERYPDSMIEVVVNARRDGHEIELYRSFDSGSCDGEGLKRELKKAMAYGRDRLVTVPTPALGKADVLFSGSDACTIYEFFTDRCD
ncbi:MAG: TldD/PmbA family protein, partial [Lachnospiraceae bacterium]|nr:TldD/PmbA family protein [Lachnospiraceae bacterium]